MDLTQTMHSKPSREVVAQRRLWEVMRNRQVEGLSFIRQVLVEPFIVDFACIEKKIIVEIDGVSNTEQQHYDQRRTEYLQSKGFVVVRFWHSEVLTDMPSVVSTLRAELAQSH
ncbi:MAG: endonuclease domain-containing protein [Algicola sp.]|nr:endonuclease domain-containing protein [Algicola sp.]